jgi:hypothetical protein
LPIRFASSPLRDRVVDLVRAGVRQVLALEIDLRAAEFAREILGEVQRRRPSDVGAEQVVELHAKRLVALRLLERDGELIERHHQRLGHIPSPIRPKVAKRVGKIGGGGHS